MDSDAKILVIGKRSEFIGFTNILREKAEVEVVEDIASAFEIAKEMRPAAIVFIMPPYIHLVTDFVKNLRSLGGFSDIEIFYIGSIIESAAQTILQECGVKTLTLGPVPPQEMARFILKSIGN